MVEKGRIAQYAGKKQIISLKKVHAKTIGGGGFLQITPEIALADTYNHI